MDCFRRRRSYVLAAVVITFLLLLLDAVRCSHGARCERNEVPARRQKCATEMTCNSCKVCSPCVCKEGFIREWPGRGCITEDQCHDLHLQWLAAAKYEGKKNTFFNCNGKPRRYQRMYERPFALHRNQNYFLNA